MSWVISYLSRVGIILSFALILLSIILRITFGFGINVNLLNRTFSLYNLLIIGIVGLIVSLISNKQFRKILIESAKNPKDLALDKSQKTHIPVNLISFILFIVLGYNYFLKNIDRTFLGYDGNYMFVLAKHSDSWNQDFFSFTANHLQGIGGNIPFAVNFKWDLGYLFTDFTQGTSQIAIAHTIWSVLLYLSSYFYCKVIWGVKSISIFAAWSVPLFFLFPSPFQISKVPLLIPHIASAASLTIMICAVLLWQPRIKSWQSLTLKIILTNFIIYYFLLINPSFLLLALPPIFLHYFMCRFYNIFLFKQNTLVLFSAILISVLAKSFFYFLGLFLYTVPFALRESIWVSPPPLSQISYLFGRNPSGKLIILIVIFTSAFIFVDQSRNKQFVLKSSLLLFIFFLLIFGFIFINNQDIWVGPTPIYFEFMFIPFYIISVSVFVLNFGLNLISRSKIENKLPND